MSSIRKWKGTLYFFTDSVRCQQEQVT